MIYVSGGLEYALYATLIGREPDPSTDGIAPDQLPLWQSGDLRGGII